MKGFRAYAVGRPVHGAAFLASTCRFHARLDYWLSLRRAGYRIPLCEIAAQRCKRLDEVARESKPGILYVLDEIHQFQIEMGLIGRRGAA